MLVVVENVLTTNKDPFLFVPGVDRLPMAPRVDPEVRAASTRSMNLSIVALWLGKTPYGYIGISDRQLAPRMRSPLWRLRFAFIR